MRNTEQAQPETRGALVLAVQGALNQNDLAAQTCAVLAGIAFVAGAKRLTLKHVRAQKRKNKHKKRCQMANTEQC